MCWHRSMMAVQRHDAGRLLAGSIEVRCGFQGVAAARNEGVRQFLRTGLSWLWWVDTDMGFEADALERLMDAADAEERPVVGALCYAQKMPGDDGMGGYVTESVPTIYDWVSDDSARGFVLRPDYPPGELVRCAGTGSAFILVHRSVLEAIGATQGACWYDPVPNPEVGGMIGEDLSFCLRCAIARRPVHVHTGVRTSHMKHVWLSPPPRLPQGAIA